MTRRQVVGVFAHAAITAVAFAVVIWMVAAGVSLWWSFLVLAAAMCGGGWGVSGALSWLERRHARNARQEAKHDA